MRFVGTIPLSSIHQPIHVYCVMCVVYMHVAGDTVYYLSVVCMCTPVHLRLYCVVYVFEHQSNSDQILTSLDEFYEATTFIGIVVENFK